MNRFISASFVFIYLIASNLNNTKLAQAQSQAWQCRADWTAGNSTYSRVNSTESEARRDLDREIVRDINNNGQNTVIKKSCFPISLSGQNSNSTSNSCANSGFNSCTRASVDRIYRDILGRGSDPGGLDSWSFAVDSRKLSLNEVRHRIAFDTESTNNVAAIYREVLGRNPDTGGLDSWRGGLANGLSLEEVRSRIALDTESRNNIQRLYSSIFRKEASSEEVHSYALRLAREGWTLDRVSQDMVSRSQGR